MYFVQYFRKYLLLARGLKSRLTAQTKYLPSSKDTFLYEFEEAETETVYTGLTFVPSPIVILSSSLSKK